MIKGVSFLGLALVWGAYVPAAHAQESGAGASLVATSAEGHSEDRKLFGVRINPMSYLFGAINLGLDFAISRRWAIGLIADYFHGHSPEYGYSNTSGFGVNGTYYITGEVMHSGFIARPTLYTVLIRPVGANGQPYFLTISRVMGLTAGYNWLISPSGFTVSLATGYALRFDHPSAFHSQPILEFTAGWVI